MTELTFLVEEVLPYMPGQFTMSRYWSSSNPTRRQRLACLLPSAMEKRLKYHWLGAPSRAPKRTEHASGLIELEWQSDGMPPSRLEVKGPPRSQVGPQLRLGTIETWDQFGAWFAGLLQKASESGKGLQHTAKDWAGDAKDQRSIAANLYRHVADDIRYTGLEFGEGD